MTSLLTFTVHSWSKPLAFFSKKKKQTKKTYILQFIMKYYQRILKKERKKHLSLKYDMNLDINIRNSPHNIYNK